MKSTIMEYGLTIFAAILVAALFYGFLRLIGDDGNLKETIIDYMTDIC